MSQLEQRANVNIRFKLVKTAAAETLECFGNVYGGEAH